MLTTRAALTALLLATPAVTALLGQTAGVPSVVQQEDFLPDTPLPAIVLAAAEPQRPLDGSPFHQEETWHLWLVTAGFDAYTLGVLADTVRLALDRQGADPVALTGAPEAAGILTITWVFDGTPHADPTTGQGELMQRYRIWRQPVLS